MAEAKKLHVRKGDTVMVISGKDAGTKGKVLGTVPSKGKVLVENVSTVVRHTKARRRGEPGGRLSQEAPINSSKVMLYCTKCNKPTRIAHKFVEDGMKLRVCKHCGETFDS